MGALSEGVAKRRPGAACTDAMTCAAKSWPMTLPTVGKECGFRRSN